jgi:hypothetical protein
MPGTPRPIGGERNAGADDRPHPGSLGSHDGIEDMAVSRQVTCKPRALLPAAPWRRTGRSRTVSRTGVTLFAVRRSNRVLPSCPCSTM